MEMNHKINYNSLGRFLLSCLISIVVLSFISMAYKHTSMHMPSNGETDHKWEANGFTSTMQEGFAFLRMDNNGYNNRCTFEKNDILLLGSSHIEAVQMQTENNAASQLNDLLNYNTYSIGVSSHNLYRCVSNYLAAVKEYEPTHYTIIETGSVKLSNDDMKEVKNGADKPAASPDTGVKALIQFIPMAKPTLNQLSAWATLKNPTGGTTQLETNLPDGYVETLHSFLSIVSDTAKENNITPIIFYHPSEQLNLDGTVTYKTDSLYLKCFASTCKDLGIVFIDMTDSFENLCATEHQLAHGFINTAVGSGHLNKYGHRVIAEKLAEVIWGLEAE